MIDACQDTDSKQWDILSQCCFQNNPLGDKKLFLVGDTKQCIYRFRGADPSFYSQLSESFSSKPQTSKSLSLTDNFRSSPTLIHHINTLFAHIFEKSTEKLLIVEFPNSKLSAEYEPAWNDMIDLSQVKDKVCVNLA